LPPFYSCLAMADPDSITRHLQATQGWLELGDWQSAFDELEQLEPEDRGRLPVLVLRWNIYSAAGLWDYAVEIARAIRDGAPDESTGYWMLSYALHELKRTREAYENHAAVQDKFPQESIILYNLACYLAQLGRLVEARSTCTRQSALSREAEGGTGRP
jgi:tetratricopeptide (TPR) repeat protein